MGKGLLYSPYLPLRIHIKPFKNLVIKPHIILGFSPVQPSPARVHERGRLAGCREDDSCLREQSRSVGEGRA